ncbi:MAG TPA: YkgJ family cysteine cluster protein [Chloroflexota bacterium]
MNGERIDYNPTMSAVETLRGPIAGEPTAIHGGSPGAAGCHGCTDCCHLPEISITNDEAARLEAIYNTLEEPLGELLMEDDPAFEGWKVMKGPCVFRRPEATPTRGGCRIYSERPGACAVFMCSLLLDLRRAATSKD